jgi:cytochrome c oxidase subunit 3
MSIVKTDSLGNKYAEHYQDSQHQYATGKHGVWLFMVTEMMMFGGLFVAYTVFKNIYPDVFHAGHKFLDWKLGALNTVVLLSSSLTMALSIHYVQKGKPKAALGHLAFTFLCGAAFMVIKYFEYTHKIHLGLTPGKFFHFAEMGGEPVNLALYFGIYYCMTGLHGIHVLTGMFLIGWSFLKVKRGVFTPTQYTFLEGTGIFWHIVDLIWIYLFPLLYLVI